MFPSTGALVPRDAQRQELREQKILETSSPRPGKPRTTLLHPGNGPAQRGPRPPRAHRPVRRRRVPIGARQPGKAKNNRSSFPKGPQRTAARPAPKAAGAPPSVPAARPARPGQEERARSGASRAGGRAGGGRGRGGGRLRGGRRPGGEGRAEATPIGAPIRQRVVGGRALQPSLRPHRVRSRAAPGRGRSGRSARARGAAGSRHRARPAQRP